MLSTKPFIVVVAALAGICAFLIPMAPAQAANKFQVLHAFHGKDGQSPSAGVIFDAAGNLYGTTTWGGDQTSCSSCGTVFQLTPGASGEWTEKVLHSFNGTDGDDSYAGLILDAAGNLYGTTTELASGWGNVFKLTPGANGEWSETVLHTFDLTDGEYPWAGVISDSAGNLYGTTYEGGNYKGECSDGGCGVVFKLAPGAGGKWSDTTIRAFNGRNGYTPLAGLILDSAGNLYGTTAGGGAKRLGIVFKLTLANGKWTETELHAFGLGDGYGPNAGVIFDRAGNLYGTTYAGGNSRLGVVFELMPGANGKWTEKVLHIFRGSDGNTPDGGVILDGAGNLYGTTALGGAHNYGTVFKLTPHSNGTWTERVLHSFNGGDGAEPSGNLVFGTAGSLYGTTFLGGNFTGCGNKSGCGVVFKVTP